MENNNMSENKSNDHIKNRLNDDDDNNKVNKSNDHIVNKSNDHIVNKSNDHIKNRLNDDDNNRLNDDNNKVNKSNDHIINKSNDHIINKSNDHIKNRLNDHIVNKSNDHIVNKSNDHIKNRSNKNISYKIKETNKSKYKLNEKVFDSESSNSNARLEDINIMKCGSGINEDSNNDYVYLDKHQYKNGWRNLIGILAFLSIMKHIITNIKTMGFIMGFPFSGITFRDLFWFLFTFGFIVVRCILIYKLYRFKKISFFLVFIFEIITLIIIFKKINYPYICGWGHILSIVVSLKHISFLLKCDDNNFARYLYFLFIPTLVYQKMYKTKANINWKKVYSKSVYFCLYFILFIFFMDQHAIPAIYSIFYSPSFFFMIENFINLSIATIILFKLFFELVFRCFIEIISEMLKYDEYTYSEWWNSMSVKDFWIKWNRPVSQFMKIHIYNNLIKNKINVKISRLICFFISGVAHELVTIISLKKFTGWMIIGMVAQIPLIYITDKIKKKYPNLANAFFWFFFCVIGQPLVILMFYRSIRISQKNNLNGFSYEKIQVPI